MKQTYIWLETLSPAQTDQLHELYRQEWWTKQRTKAEVKRMLEHAAYIFPLADAESGRLIAFGRVLTDRVFKALIFDIVVDNRYRGQGLGRHLMDRILTHSDLKDVHHFELYCLPEMIPFYKRWGFENDLGTLTFMRRG